MNTAIHILFHYKILPLWFEIESVILENLENWKWICVYIFKKNRQQNLVKLVISTKEIEETVWKERHEEERGQGKNFPRSK